MIIDLSNHQFREIMENPMLHLPIRWDGRNFEDALDGVLDCFIDELNYYALQDKESIGLLKVDLSEIVSTCSDLKACVREYHKGFPSHALSVLNRIMSQLVRTPLEVYQKDGEPIEGDKLRLYRIRNVNSGIQYSRKDIFHVPVNTRPIISTCRYSIAGYPSLYLTTSLALGMEETAANSEHAIASKFIFEQPQRRVDIHVLELGIKPQDFLPDERREGNRSMPRVIRDRLSDDEVREAYLRWYPVIAAGSFIRANRAAPFASEYIVPQLLMQWIRTQSKRNSLMGIRYFSCASIRASEMGYDYVFPANNYDYEDNYCSILRDAFLLTEPVHLRDYDDAPSCEHALEQLALQKI